MFLKGLGGAWKRCLCLRGITLELITEKMRFCTAIWVNYDELGILICGTLCGKHPLAGVFV